MIETRLEYKDESSEKFWTISLAGASHTVRYGRIGSVGQEKIKKFATEDEARKSRDKLVAQKLKKGYYEISTELSIEASKDSSIPTGEHWYSRFASALKEVCWGTPCPEADLIEVEGFLGFSLRPEFRQYLLGYDSSIPIFRDKVSIQDTPAIIRELTLNYGLEKWEKPWIPLTHNPECVDFYAFDNESGVIRLITKTYTLGQVARSLPRLLDGFLADLEDGIVQASDSLDSMPLYSEDEETGEVDEFPQSIFASTIDFGDVQSFFQDIERNEIKTLVGFVRLARFRDYPIPNLAQLERAVYQRVLIESLESGENGSLVQIALSRCPDLRKLFLALSQNKTPVFESSPPLDRVANFLRIRLLTVVCKRGYTDVAIDLLKGLVEPSQQELTFLVESLEQLGRKEEAVEFSARDPGLKDVNRAQQAYDKREFESVLEILQRADLSEHPVFARALELRINSLKAIGRDREAEPLLLRLDFHRKNPPKSRKPQSTFVMALPCGCQKAKITRTVRADGTLEHSVTHPVEEPVTQNPTFGGEVPDGHYAEIKCSQCCRPWALAYDRPGNGPTRLSLKDGDADLTGLMEEARNLLKDGLHEEAWNSWHQLKDRPMFFGSDAQEHLIQLGVDCALAFKGIAEALELATPSKNRGEHRRRIMGSLPQEFSAELVELLNARPAMEVLLERFRQTEPAISSRPGSLPTKVMLSATLQDDTGGAVQVEIPVTIEDERVLLEFMKVAPAMEQKLFQAEFEDDPKKKATIYFQLARSCLASGFDEHALVLFECAEQYFPESVMVREQLENMREAGVQKTDASSGLETRIRPVLF